MKTNVLFLSYDSMPEHGERGCKKLVIIEIVLNTISLFDSVFIGLFNFFLL